LSFVSETSRLNMVFYMTQSRRIKLVVYWKS